MYRVELLASAVRELERVQLVSRRRLVRRIDQLAVDPRGRDSVKLRGAEGVWRTRVGDFRILYRIDDAGLLVLVVRVAKRSDVYR